MIKEIFILVIVVALITGLAACGSKDRKSSGNDSNYGIEEKKLIGFANLTDEIDFGQAVKRGIIEEAKKAGYDIVSVDNRLDGATAVANADNLITRGIDFMIQFNVDSKVAPVIMEMMDAAGIPVIAIDIPHPGAVFFGADNPTTGIMTGEALVGKAIEKWEGKVDLVILVESRAAGGVPQQRMEGVLNGVREHIDVPDNKVIRVDGKNDVLNAQRVVTDTLTANPNARNILIGCLNDQNGQGALAAVEASNRSEHVFIASQGADKPALDNLKSGEDNSWIGSTAFFPETYGEQIIPLVARILNGEEVPDMNYTEHVFIDRDNIYEYYPDK